MNRNHGIIRTESGAEYFVEERDTPNGPILYVRKDGWEKAKPAFALYPDRLKYLAATTKKGWNGRQAVGRNDAGKVTLRFHPMQVRKRMHLVNTKGFLSTAIVSVPESLSG